MRRLVAIAALVSLACTSLQAQQRPAADTASGSRFALAWNAYLTPQIWPDIGADDDQKFGIGFGGMLGIAWIWDDLVIGVGPHLSYQMWSADYSGKPNSATQSISIGMADAGIELIGQFDKSMGFWAGTGSATMDASMLLENGDTFYYPGLDGEQFSYLAFGLTFKAGQRFRFGFGVTQYEEAAQDANRVEIRFGLGY